MKPSSDITRLLEIMAALRTPGTGCPWDLEQNFASIAPYTLEEAYEVADAIERGDLPGVNVEPAPVRQYPEGSLAPQILGFLGRDRDGLAGLEYLFDSELAGEDGGRGGVVAHRTTLPSLMGLFGRKKKKDLVFEGIGGHATIRSATRDERIHKVDESDDPMLADLGIGTRKYRLELDVQLDDRRPVYQVSGRFKIPVEVGELDVGQQLPLRADPDEPQTVELDWDAWAASPEQAELRDGFDAEEKAVVHDGFGVWCATRRLNQGRFLWPAPNTHSLPALTREQFNALIVGLPWQRLQQLQVITRV